MSLAGNDTLTLWGRVFADFANNDTISIAFENDLVTTMNSKNGNGMVAKNADGNRAILSLRLLKGSSDDKFLNSKLILLNNDLPSFVFGTGEFVKSIGDGEGNISREIYSLQGVMPKKQIDAKENVNGDTEQLISIYTLDVIKAQRSLA
jgi:hypothetical protein